VSHLRQEIGYSQAKQSEEIGKEDGKYFRSGMESDCLWSCEFMVFPKQIAHPILGCEDGQPFGFFGNQCLMSKSDRELAAC
jgi:hypothetical protein